MRILKLFIVVILHIFLAYTIFPSPSFSAEVTLFEQTFVREKGKPVTEEVPFDIPAPAEEYNIIITNGNSDGTNRCSSADADINGITIIRPSDLNQNVYIIERDIQLNPANLLTIELRSAPGCFLNIKIIGIDSTPPDITITSPGNGDILGSSVTPVSGTIDDPYATVTVNGVEAQNSGGIFQATIPLNYGSNTILAEARDFYTNTNSDEITVISDTIPPVITINPTPEYISSHTIELFGSINDLTATTVSIQSQSVSVPAGGGTFGFTVSLNEGLNTLTVTAVDSAGNSSDAGRTITSDTTPPVVTINTPVDGLLTNIVIHTVSGTVTDASPVESVLLNTLSLTLDAGAFSQEYSFEEGINTLTVTATDKAGNSGSASIEVTLDTIPPAPPVIDPLPEITNTANITVSGATEAGALVKIAGQGETTADNSGVFSMTVSLAPDTENSFSATATDEAGNESQPSVFTIQQDSIPPEVTGFSLLADPKVTLDIPVSITFTEELDPVTVNSSNITIEGPSGFVDGSLSLSGTEVIFTPSLEFPANQLFTLTAGIGIKDLAGNNLASAFTGTFETLRGPAFILGEVYDDTLGLPVEGADIRVLTINNEAPDPALSALTGEMGRFSIEYEGAVGDALIEIYKDGYTKALRTAYLYPNKSFQVFDLRLTPVSGAVTISASEGGSLASGDTVLNIPANALSQDMETSLTILSQQGMGYRFPIGWSPLFGADISPWGIELITPGTLSIKNTWQITDTSEFIAAFFDEYSLSWISGNASVSGEDIIVEIDRLGQYFLLIPDTVPSEPPMPSTAGETIQPSMDAIPDGGTATVELVPPSVLSQEGARGMTTVVITTQEPIPSGTPIEARITEKYNLTGGEIITTEPFAEDITLYSWPDDENDNTLSALFPATPSKYYPFGTLYYGKVDIDISMQTLDDEPVENVIGDNGGTVDGPDGISIIILPSSLTDETLFSLNTLSESELPVSGSDDLTFLGALILQMQGGTFMPDAFPQFIIPGPAAEGMEVIITRVETINSESVLTAVATGMVSGGKISISSCLTAECISTGQYVFYNPARPVGFITGEVNKSGIPVSGVVITVDNLPFKTQTDISGNFLILSLSGDYTVFASEPDTGLTASETGTIAGGESIFVQLTLTSTRPEVTAITPHDRATAVDPAGGIEVIFSEPIDLSTVDSASFQVIQEQPGINITPIQVNGYVSLKSGNTSAVFTPEFELEPDTIYRVRLTEDITDDFGEPLLPFESVFTTAEVLGNEALEPGELMASMPDENGYVTIRGGPGLSATETPVVLFNRTQGITVTITAELDGSFVGTIQVALGDRLEVHVEDLLGNVTILDPGLLQDPDGTAAVGPEGGTIYGPGGITTYIPEGAFDEFIAIKVAMVSEDVLQDVTIDPALRNAGVFQVDTGGVTANEELKVSIPAPDWITPDHQILITKVVNIRGFDELTLTSPAVLKEDESGEQGRTIISTSPPFDGIFEGGTYGLSTWHDPLTGVGFAMVETWSYYGVGYVLGDGSFSFAAPEYTRRIFPITVPVDRAFEVALSSLDGTQLDAVSILGPPARGEFIEGIIRLTDDTIPPVVDSISIPDGGIDVLPGSDVITIGLNEPLDPSTVNNDTVVVSDSLGNIVEGTVYLAADGSTIVFVPRYGYKYGLTYTISINGVRDWGGNLITGYTSTFTTFTPEILSTIDVPVPMAIDKFGNYVAVKGDDGSSLGIGLTRSYMIAIIDVSDPWNPEEVGRQDLWGYGKDIKAVSGLSQPGDYIVAVGGRSDREGFLDVIDVTDPFNPQYVEGIYLSWSPSYGTPPANVPYGGGEPSKVTVIGTNAYVANYGIGVQGIDLTAVTPPRETAQANAIGGTITGNSYYDVSKVKNNVLAVSRDTFYILSPQLSIIGQLSGLSWPYGVTGVESFPVDLDNDGNLGLAEDEDGDTMTSAQETFDLALVLTSDGIEIINVTIPESPEKMEMIPVPTWRIVVDREKRLAYTNNLHIISLKDLKPLSNPATYRVKRDFDGDGIDDRILYTMPQAFGMDMVLSDNNTVAYVADYSGGEVKIVGVGGLPYGISPSSNIYVSADNHEVEIILYEKNLSDNEPKTIQWFIEGAGGSLSETVSTSTDGIFTTTLTTSTLAGATYKIVPKLVKEDSSLEDIGLSTGNITVEPGLASDIILTPSRTNYAADETGTINIELEAKDAYGNLVVDGTAIFWDLEGDGSFAELQDETISGKANAVIRAGGFPGIQTITIIADNAQSSIQLEQMPIDITVSGSSPTVTAGVDTATIEVSVTTTADGGVTEGTKVNFFSTLGHVIGDGIISSDYTSATFNPRELTGAAIITANIGNSYGEAQIGIVPEPGLQLSFEPKVIVGDKTIDGVIEDETLTGTSIVAYQTSSILKINGIPGEQIEVQLKNTKEPVAWYLMNGLEGNIVEDIYHTHDGTAVDVTLDIANYTTGEASYKLDGTSRIEIPDAQDLHIGRLSLSLDILPGNAEVEQTLIKKNGSYLFSIVKDGTSYRAKFDVYTDQGDYSVTSTETLLPDQWSELNVAFDNNILTISVNGVENDIVVSGDIIYTNSSIIAGENLVGNLDNLKIIDLSKPGIVKFADGSEIFETTLDVNGQAFITVYSTGNLRTQSPNAWFVYSKVIYKRISENPRSSKLAVVSSKLGWHIVNVVEGVVFGTGEGFGGAAGDIAASTVLYGDVRDILQYCINFGFGVAETGEKLVCSFAAIGVVSQLYPPADPFVALAKIVAKKVANTRIAGVLVKVKDKILKSRSWADVKKAKDQYSNIFGKIAYDDEYTNVITRVFREGTSETDEVVEGWFETLAKLENKHGDNFSDLFKRLDVKFRSLNNVDADSVLRNTIHANQKVLAKLEPLGIELTTDAIEGVGTLMRFTGGNGSPKIFFGNPKKAENIVDVILRETPEGVDKGQVVNNIFTWLKQADDAATPGLYNFAATLGNMPRNTTNFVKGGYHNLDYAANTIRFNNIEKMEDLITGRRRIDILTKDSKRYELKNFTNYGSSNTNRVLDQLRKDLAKLSPEEIENLHYVFRGSSTGADTLLSRMQKVADEILGKESKQIFDVTKNVEFLNKGVF